MTEPLTRSLDDEYGRAPATNVEPPAEPGKPTRATPEDEAAADDPLGRTNDGPVASNRAVPPGADHGGRDRGAADPPGHPGRGEGAL